MPAISYNAPLKNTGRQLWRLGLVAVWICWGLLQLLLLTLLPDRHISRLRLRLSRRWHQGLLRILHVRLECHGNLGQSGLLVANHVSWLDIPVIGSLVPVRTLAKAELRQWPVLGWLFRGSGTLFIRRGAASADLQTQLGQVLHQQQNLLLFPEGTSSDGQQVLKFHARLFACLQAGEQPLYPLCLHYPHPDTPNPIVPYINDDHFLGSLLKICAATEIRVQVYLGSPVWPQALSRNQLAGVAEQQIRQRLQQCLTSDVKGMAPTANALLSAQ